MACDSDVSADLEEMLAFAAATNLVYIRAVPWTELRKHIFCDDVRQNFREKIGFQGITSHMDLAPGVLEFFS